MAEPVDGGPVIDWLLRTAKEPAVHLAGRDVPLAIRRHARATRLTMRLAPDGSEVRVTIPQWGRTQDAVAFAASRTAWLEQQLAALPQASPPAPDGVLRWRGQHLIIVWSASHPRRPALGDGEVRVGGPQDTVAARLKRWLEAEALSLLADDLAHYCARADVAVPQLGLSRATRRWGSCSGKGVIRINWRLVMAPDHVRRSVVAHEVAHLAHFDHSPAFHAHLAALFDGDLAAADQWLKREGRGLYSAFG